MLRAQDLLLGQLAVERGLIDAGRLAEACRTVDADPEAPPLDVVLVERGWVTCAAIEALHHVGRDRLAQWSHRSGARAWTWRFAARAEAQGLVTAAQLQRALREQARLGGEAGAWPPLGEVLIAHGVLDRAQADRALRLPDADEPGEPLRKLDAPGGAEGVLPPGLVGFGATSVPAATEAPAATTFAPGPLAALRAEESGTTPMPPSAPMEPPPAVAVSIVPPEASSRGADLQDLVADMEPFAIIGSRRRRGSEDTTVLDLRAPSLELTVPVEEAPAAAVEPAPPVEARALVVVETTPTDPAEPGSDEPAVEASPAPTIAPAESIPVDAEATLADAEMTPASAEATPVGVEATPVGVEATPVGGVEVLTCPAAIESVPDTSPTVTAEPVAAEPVSESFREEFTGLFAEQSPEPDLEPSGAPGVGPAAEPIAPLFAIPVAEPVVESVAETVSAPVTEPIAQPVAESVAERVTESTAESVAEPVAESVAEPVAESGAESVPPTVAPATSEPPNPAVAPLAPAPAAPPVALPPAEVVVPVSVPAVEATPIRVTPPARVVAPPAPVLPPPPVAQSPARIAEAARPTGPVPPKRASQPTRPPAATPPGALPKGSGTNRPVAPARPDRPADPPVRPPGRPWMRTALAAGICLVAGFVAGRSLGMSPSHADLERARRDTLAGLHEAHGIVDGAAEAPPRRTDDAQLRWERAATRLARARFLLEVDRDPGLVLAAAEADARESLRLDAARWRAGILIAEAQLLRGRWLQRQGQPAATEPTRAREGLDQLLAAHANDPDVLRVRAEVRGVLGDFAGAEADLKRAEDQAADDPVAWVQIGDAWHALNQCRLSGDRFASAYFDRADECFTRVLTRHPDSVLARVRRAESRSRAASQAQAVGLSASRHLQGALEDLNQALAVAPENAELLVRRGFTHYDLADGRSAQADFEAAVRLDPSLQSAVHATLLLARSKSSKQNK